MHEHGGSSLHRTPEQISQHGIAIPWQCRKRDGNTVPFDCGKISAALYKCFTNLPESSQQATISNRQELINALTSRVVNSLAAQKKTTPEVEEIQRLVIQQLWAEGLFDAAESYQNYREQRRQARLRQEGDPHLAKSIAADAVHFPSSLQYFQFLDKYSRWDEAKQRRETWRECCDRVMGWFRKQPQLAVITPQEWQKLDGAIYRMEVSPAMRIVQMAGPALDRCSAGCYNCAYTACDDLGSFVETLYLLMSGCGVGFSVESDHVDRLPRVRKQKSATPHIHDVQDSTEGWCDAYQDGLETWFRGEDVEYRYHLVRPAGARLKTKGGRASGYTALKSLLDFARTLVLARQGKHLTTRDCHDLMCMTGKIVQMGGVRRASELSLSDLDDSEMRDCKSGNWWSASPWLDMANLSAVYEEKPDALTFMTEWLALARSGSGERGIFNRGGIQKHIPVRRKKARFGVNPCQPGFATVLTPDGVRTFDRIDVNSIIWSGSRWTTVISKTATGIKPVFRYITTAGCFVGTADHQVFQHGKRVAAALASDIDICPEPHESGRETWQIPVAVGITTVEPLGEMPVYDITVDAPEHSYWTDGLRVSNCGEVILRSRQFCNLSICIARHDDTPETLEAKVILASMLGTMQSTFTNFRYIRDEWRVNCEEERLLGVDINGQMDCPILRPGVPGREALLDHLRETAVSTNRELAARLGIPASAATTVVKPSGNSAALFGCSSGGSTHWAKYRIRRVRVNRQSPMALLLIDEGVPHSLDPMNDTLLVFDFLPDPAPDGSPTRNDLSAREQFLNWLVWREHWTEHNVSATLTVRPDEWLELGALVYQHFDRISGLTFLPHDGGNYRLAPNEEISEADYRERKKKFPAINWARLSAFEMQDTTTPGADATCPGGVCDAIGN